jgi:hypothetical protein
LVVISVSDKAVSEKDVFCALLVQDNVAKAITKATNFFIGIKYLSNLK